jgi:hypothetical protein
VFVTTPNSYEYTHFAKKGHLFVLFCSFVSKHKQAVLFCFTSVKLREEHNRSRVFENRTLRGVLGSKGGENNRSFRVALRQYSTQISLGAGVAQSV